MHRLPALSITVALLLAINVISLATAQINPEALEPITPDNAGRVEQLAVLGSGQVNELAWSPDGNILAVASSVGVLLYDASVLDALPQLLQGHTGTVTSLVFSSDGTMLASSSYEGIARLWDAASGEQRAALAGHGTIAFGPDGILVGSFGSQGGTAVSPDGTLLAYFRCDDIDSTGHCDYYSIWVREAVSGQEYAVMGAPELVESIVFSPDGTMVATEHYGGTLRLSDVPSGRERAVLQAPEQVVGMVFRTLAFNLDGTMLAFSDSDGTMRLWDTASGQERAVLHGHTDRVTSIVFNADGTVLVSASWDGTVRLWDVATGEERAVLQGHADWVNSVAFSPDGTLLASGGQDGKVRLWGVTGES